MASSGGVNDARWSKMLEIVSEDIFQDVVTYLEAKSIR